MTQTKPQAGHSFTFEGALEGARFNASRTGRPRWVVGYLQTWRAEGRPAGDFCYRVEPSGEFYRVERNGDKWERAE